jgi:hypothetical protein
MFQKLALLLSSGKTVQPSHLGPLGLGIEISSFQCISWLGCLVFPVEGSKVNFSNIIYFYKF